MSNTTNVNLPPPEVDINISKAPKEKDPPLFSFQITNPITYLKNWWKKLIGNEGVKLTIQIKPITAFVLAAIFCGAGFSFGRLTLPEPIIKYLPSTITTSASPSPTPDPWKETAFTGKLQKANGKFFLSTTSAEAITLDVPDTINLTALIGKRILVVGRYNKDTKIMVVTGTPDLEILPPSPLPIPTTTPSPIPTNIPSSLPE